jgi:outer membrane receptor protein involved in Fe transport
MSIHARRVTFQSRAYLLGSSALLAVIGFAAPVCAQVALPQVNITAPKHRPKPRRVPRPAATPAVAPAAPLTATRQLQAKSNSFDAARSNLYTTIGTTSDTLNYNGFDTLPQGANAPVEKIMLQFPGVSQDSAASGLLHVRNDHANVQYRINGVMLPDGVTGFGSIFDSDYIGSMSLVTGALPAEFGMRTVGLLDITTRADVFNNSGTVGVYGGSFGQITPYFDYGGTVGSTCPSSSAPTADKAPPSSWGTGCFPGVQYFFSGRYLQTNEGIENATSSYFPIHDFSQQERGFGYMSAFIDPTTRLSLIEGTANNDFQIPNNPGQPVAPMFPTAAFNSALLNENQTEFTQYGVLALQKSAGGFDGQLSYFTRYNELHFIPDPTGDLLLNGIASDVTRESDSNGVQGDASYQLNPWHTIRAGFTVSGEQTSVGNSSVVVPCTACDGSDTGAPETITDDASKLGWLAGVYGQDEWKITNQLTMNAGLRFDQMWQYVDANQLSPRLSFTYKPFADTTLHAGYARYFTPPVLVEAAPFDPSLYNGTSAASSVTQASPVLPERSNYFDAGADQLIKFDCTSTTDADCSTLDLGIDAYYKLAKDLIDNGNFGEALVLSAFNYAKGIVEGLELSAKYKSGPLQAYANFAAGYEKATDVVSNQYLFSSGPLADLGGETLLQYVDSHWIYTDHTQKATGSAGLIYQVCGRAAYAQETFGGASDLSWCGTKFSADMIYGYGLRAGDANIDHVPQYTQFNIGIAREFLLPNDPKPMTVRFDIVNLFDTSYLIRGGAACVAGGATCGIGVFAPQYGPRRGYFIGISKKI